jgi:GLPGLI family protein
MTKYLIPILLLTCYFSSVFAQKKTDFIKVTYERASNGKLLENQDRIVIFSSLQSTFIVTESIVEKKAAFPIEQTYFDRESDRVIQIAQLKPNSQSFTIDSTEFRKYQFEYTSDTKRILGYVCKRATTEINSNKIDLWYTTGIPIKGAPNILGQNLGLVLQVIRNGNFETTATKVEVLKKLPENLIEVPKGQKPVDLLSYRDALWKSRFVKLPLFNNQIINYAAQSYSNDSISHFANGTIIAKKIKFPKLLQGQRIFVDASQKSNGDAYDRTGSIFIIPNSEISYLDALKTEIKTLPAYQNGNGKIYQGVVRTNNYEPPVELMRFFTPFGIAHFNTIKIKNHTWQDSVSYRQEITELASLLSDSEVWIGAAISNYDKGGHRLSANITIHLEETLPVDNFALPLFQTHNIMEAAGQEYPTMFDVEKGLEVTFKLAQPIENATLRYIATGHGGWENGDEFVQKVHTIVLDGKAVHQFIPWRVDCGSYRSYNPASGNFSNGLSSSDYSRSNWCPGTVTSPNYIPLGNLAAGDHQIQIKIPQGASEGGSFSAWAVSGVLIGRVTR